MPEGKKLVFQYNFCVCLCKDMHLMSPHSKGWVMLQEKWEESEVEGYSILANNMHEVKHKFCVDAFYVILRIIAIKRGVFSTIVCCTF